MKKYKYVLLIFIIYSLNIASQDVKRVGYSNFFEVGASCSPEGNYYLHYGTKKSKLKDLNSFPEENYYLNIIKMDELSLDNDTLGDYRSFTSIEEISYPYAFLDWKSDHEFFLLNLEEQSIWVYDISKKDKILWFNTSIDLLDSITFTSIVMKNIRFKFLKEKGEIIMYYNNKNLIKMNYLKGRKKEEVIIRNDNELVSFDINMTTHKVAGFVYNEKSMSSNLIIYDLKTNDEKVVHRDIEEFPSRSSIAFLNNSDLFTYRIRTDVEGEIEDHIYLYNESRKPIEIFKLSGLFYDMVHFDYNPASKYKIAYTMWGKNKDTPEQKIKHDDVSYDVATLFYVGMASK